MVTDIARPTRKHFTILLSIALLLVACQDPATPTQSGTSPPPMAQAIPVTSGDKDTVVIRFTCNAEKMSKYQSLADEFHRRYPHISIDIIPIENVLPSPPISELELGLAIVSSADTIAWSLSPYTVRLGLIKDLTPFVSGDAGFDHEDFYPFMLDYYHWGDGLWALPGWAFPTAVFYNEDAFDRANLAYPQPGWDQDEFLRLAQQLTIREDNKTRQYGFAGSTDFALLPMMQGAIPVDPFALPQLDTPEVVEALRWYADLAYVHGVMPEPGASSQGQSAMWVDYVVNFQQRQATSRYDIGIAPFPLGDGNANPYEISGYYMSSGTTVPQESWQWLKFLTHYRGDNNSNAIFPSRYSVTEELGYWAQWQADEAEALQFSLVHAFGYPYGQTTEALRRALMTVWQGEVPEEAAAAAQQQAMEKYEQYLNVTPVAVHVAPAADPEARQSMIFASAGFDTGHYQELARAFNAGQEAVRVEVVSSQESKTADCFEGPPDITQGQGATQPLNLQPLLESGDSLSAGDFAFTDAFRRQGDLYGIPAYAAAPVLFYNPGLFDAADLSYPQPGWTLDEFLHAARTLTLGEGETKQYGFVPLDGDAGVLPLFTAAQGVDLWDAEGQPRFDTPEVVEAVSWYADLALEHGVMPVPPDDLPNPTPADRAYRQALVQQGRVAMWTGLTGLGQEPERAGAKMVPLPGERALLIPYGFFIAADTQNAAGCWDWLVYAATNPSPELGIPAYRPALMSDAFVTQVGPDVAATYRALVDHEPVTQPAGSEAQRLALLEALAEIFRGTDPQAALSEAQHNIQSP